MINLNEIKERRKAAGVVVAKLLTTTDCPVKLEEIKTLLSCLDDLQRLNELVNLIGENSIKQYMEKVDNSLGRTNLIY